MDGSVMALKQEFCHAGSESEVAVNLERRMSIEKIRVDTPVGIFFCKGIARQQIQHVVDDRQGMIAVKHPCPEVDLPSEAPSGSHIPTLQERGTRTFEKVGRTER